MVCLTKPSSAFRARSIDSLKSLSTDSSILTDSALPESEAAICCACLRPGSSASVKLLAGSAHCHLPRGIPVLWSERGPAGWLAVFFWRGVFLRRLLTKYPCPAARRDFFLRPHPITIVDRCR